MLAIRVRFKKEGRARYISHLDLNRCMQRALRRAHIPVWRTQGFNPHPYIVFAMPLSIFYESDCEIMDARLDGEMPLDEVARRLNENLPEGIAVTDVFEPKKKLAEIANAAYFVSLDFAGEDRGALSQKLSAVMANETLIVEKSTKRSSVELDVKPYLEKAEAEVADGRAEFKVTLPAGSQSNLNPSLLVEALEKYGMAPELVHIRRTAILDADLAPFE